MTPVVVLYCCAKANIAAIPEKERVFQKIGLGITKQDLPIPESKSGTMAASVMMNR